ncbi:MAG: hypothetical protein HYY08_02305 [Firmicutes bacterium]|nr:hypothetical protein [Bacillota bacterium]
MHLGEPDRVPVSPHGLGRLDPDGEVAHELIKKADVILPTGLGPNPFLGSRAQISTTKSQGEQTTVLHTPRGDLTERYKWTSVTGCVVEFFCKGIEDAERLLSIPFEPAEPDLSEFTRWKARLGQEGLVIGSLFNAICFPAMILSPEDMCLVWAEERDFFLHLIETGAQRINDFAERACRKGAEGFRIIGGEYATEQLGPTAFKLAVKRLDKQLVEILHDHRASVYYHNHGRVNGYLEDLADIGMDALDPLEMPPYGDVVLADAKRRIGDSVCLVGPLDDMEVLETRDEAYCRDLALECLRAAGRNGYILGGTASGTYTERGARNFIALVDAAQEHALCG